MGKNIKSITEMLQLGCCSEENLKYAIDYLIECDIASLSEERLEVANLYYEILQQIPHVYAYEDHTIPENIMDTVRMLFENIQGIVENPTEREQQEVSFSVVEFLSYLRRHNSITGDNDFSKTDESVETVNSLNTDLGAIQYIFDIKQEGQLYFPIEKMLASVIKDKQFVNDISCIDSGHIKVLYLAVRFFDQTAQKTNILSEIIERCHLKFIEYMQDQSEILDTVDLHNYRKNGVITFLNSRKGKILIRHNERQYFPDNEDVQEELSYNGDRKIGFYVEKDIPSDARPVTFNEVMLKEPRQRLELLKLFYSGYKNIFGKYYLMERNGVFSAINLYANKDSYIVEEQRECACDNTTDILENYYNLSVKESGGCPLNHLTVGMLVAVLEIEDTHENGLFNIQYTDDAFYQNQLIMKWLSMAKNKNHAVCELTHIMYQELKYCIKCKSESDRDELSIESHKIGIQKFLPFYMDLLQILCVVDENWKEKRGTIQQASIRHSKELGRAIVLTENDPVMVVEGDDIIANQLSLGELDLLSTCFVVVDETNCVYLEDQRILKALYGLQTVMENCLKYETAQMIDKIQYNGIKQGVKLHKKGLSEAIPEKSYLNICFDEQFRYRLIHNMICYRINVDNVEHYLKIFQGHQLLAFDRVKDDDLFQMNDQYTLYVPKDSFGEDSTLGNIYMNYLKTESKRDKFALYKNDISYSTSKKCYMLNGKPIRHIVFLNDNFESGSGTTVVLSAYLNLLHQEPSKVDNAKKRIQTYFYYEGESRKSLNLTEILDTNCCDITVHAYYGTQEGAKFIADFLCSNEIENVKVTYKHEITYKFKAIRESVDVIWGNYQERYNEKYAVIREFNMTKVNIFPKEMLQHPEKAICMYLIKKENVSHNRRRSVVDKTDWLKELKQYFRKKGIKENDRRTNTELYLFSTLPPTMRIEVLEDYLQMDHNLLVLDKLSKAYGKADQLETLRDRVEDWRKRGYIDEDFKNVLIENAELMHRYADKFPIAKSMSQARRNYDNAISVVMQPVDNEFKEIMQGILDLESSNN